MPRPPSTVTSSTRVLGTGELLDVRERLAPELGEDEAGAAVDERDRSDDTVEEDPLDRPAVARLRNEQLEVDLPPGLRQRDRLAVDEREVAIDLGGALDAEHGRTLDPEQLEERAPRSG